MNGYTAEEFSDMLLGRLDDLDLKGELATYDIPEGRISRNINSSFPKRFTLNRVPPFDVNDFVTAYRKDIENIFLTLDSKTISQRLYELTSFAYRQLIGKLISHGLNNVTEGDRVLLVQMNSLFYGNVIPHLKKEQADELKRKVDTITKLVGIDEYQRFNGLSNNCK